MKFLELDFQIEIQEALKKLNFVDCTPIQEDSMPHIIKGKDVAGLAQTGTGKTAAFLLPLMDRILKSHRTNETAQTNAFKDWKKNEFVLVLVPTRELAEQVYNNFMDLRGDSGLQGVSVFGGVSYDRQIEGIKKGVEFVIATPGRLIDLFKEKHVDLKQVRAIVFDEADRMFDMGFKDDMKYILERVPRDRQFIVFSATLNFDVMNVAYSFGADPIECNISKDQAKAENVEDELFHVGHNEKPMYLLSLIKSQEARQVIVFSNFKFNVGRIAEFLSKNGVPAMGISSLLNQSQRQRVMEQFKSSSSGQNVLIATDVAARGLDVKGVDLVVNFELPDDAENYVHRIGRTGRAGTTGKAFSLVSDMDVEALARIEDYLGHKVPIGWLDDEQMIKEFKSFPSERKDIRKPKFQHDANKAKSSYNAKDGKRGDKKYEKKSSYKKSDDDFSRKKKSKKKFKKTDLNKKDDFKSAGSKKKKSSNKRKRPANTRPSGRPRRASGKKKDVSVAGKIGGFFKKLFGG